MAGDVVTILAVTAVMLALLEVPLLCFTVAPEWTPRAIERFKEWLGTHGGRVIVTILTLVGLALIVRGVLVLHG